MLKIVYFYQAPLLRIAAGTASPFITSRPMTTVKAAFFSLSTTIQMIARTAFPARNTGGTPDPSAPAPIHLELHKSSYTKICSDSCNYGVIAAVSHSSRLESMSVGKRFIMSWRRTASSIKGTSAPSYQDCSGSSGIRKPFEAKLRPEHPMENFLATL